jgi:hypothetical protein
LIRVLTYAGSFLLALGRLCLALSVRDTRLPYLSVLSGFQGPVPAPEDFLIPERLYILPQVPDRMQEIFFCFLFFQLRIKKQPSGC